MVVGWKVGKMAEGYRTRVERAHAGFSVRSNVLIMGIR